MEVNYHLLLVLFFYSVVSYTNGLFAINMINPIINTPALPDIGFYYLPIIPNSYPNILLIVFVTYFCIRFIRDKNVDQLIKLLWCISILFLFRIITFSVTIVPPVTTGCYSRNSNSSIEWNVLKYLLSTDDNTCVDYMFSGHAVYYMVPFLFLLKMSTYAIEKILCTFYVIVGIFSIVSGHIHYTADVIVALILSVGIYLLFTSNNMTIIKIKIIR
jgi:hypothetical protein